MSNVHEGCRLLCASIKCLWRYLALFEKNKGIVVLNIYMFFLKGKYYKKGVCYTRRALNLKARRTKREQKSAVYRCNSACLERH